ncbi:arabinosyltransferase domain-containing protein [Herbiconiux sp. SYSU D00978]|uniref:arabinosyltransferase domain-containing protein n=1 Tax=Herbiconiux sp. SYSU D00978 TaxID=2812562 RepID=UPI001F6044E6|nr:arabinosyltransferase domain-containing protein [Herbiconiux sp. SYSU D00978]
MVAGFGLAIAPVDVSEVRVSWPQDASAPEPTSLMLANQTPYSIEVGFDDESLRAAAGGGGLLLSTIDAADESSARAGLKITATDAAATIAGGGESFTREWADTSEWVVHATTTGGTVVRIDGQEAVRWPDVLPPQVDGLFTDVDALPAGALSVELQVVNDYDSTPTPLKLALMVILWLAVALTFILLVIEFRHSRVSAPLRVRAFAWLRTLGAVDIAVVAGLVLWVFIGPMTDDDGYYAAMSLSYGDAGYVGNYYQMYNQPFAPFTWFWEFLYYWQQIGGRSPVWLRVPALIAGIVAWLVARTLLSSQLADARRWTRTAAVALLALVFCGWWFAFSIGSRPEIVGAAGSVAVIALVLRAISRNTLVPAFAAAVVAGLAFAAHPTGVVTFAPLLLALPSLWTVARTGTDLLGAAARTAGVLSAGAVALFVAFRDASLNDVLAGRATFAAVETPQTWMDEWDRYSFLMSPIAMGSYAKRSFVLVGLVLLLWFVVATVFAKGRLSLPPVYRLTGWTFALSLVLLWITPSKWTHHFGALATVGPLMIVLVLIVTPRLLARSEESSVPSWLAPLAVASLIPPIVVGLSGPNSWAYSWDQGMFRHGDVPGFNAVRFDSLGLWLLVAVVSLAVAVVVIRRRFGTARSARALLAATGLVTVFALLTTGYLVATFALSAFRGSGYYTPGGANLADPLAENCLIDEAIEIWDASEGTPLAVAEGESRLTGTWQENAGWPEADPLPPTQAGVTVWGSANQATQSAGTLTTPVYDIPALDPDQRLVLLVGGDLNAAEPNSVRIEYAARGSSAMQQLEVDFPGEQPGWRTLNVPLPPQLAQDGGVLRVVAEDATTLENQWLAVSSPLVVNGRPLSAVVPPGAATAVSWTSSFWFPCQRPMSVSNGIFERPVMATSWGTGAPDNIWVEARGGQMVAPARTASVSVPYTEFDTAGTAWGNIQLLRYDVAPAAYDLRVARVTLPGWVDPFGPTALLVSAERDG